MEKRLIKNKYQNIPSVRSILVLKTIKMVLPTKIEATIAFKKNAPNYPLFHAEMRTAISVLEGEGFSISDRLYRNRVEYNIGLVGVKPVSIVTVLGTSVTIRCWNQNTGKFDHIKGWSLNKVQDNFTNTIARYLIGKDCNHLTDLCHWIWEM